MPSSQGQTKVRKISGVIMTHMSHPSLSMSQIIQNQLILLLQTLCATC